MVSMERKREDGGPGWQNSGRRGRWAASAAAQWRIGIDLRRRSSLSFQLDGEGGQVRARSRSRLIGEWRELLGMC